MLQTESSRTTKPNGGFRDSLKTKDVAVTLCFSLARL